jgi:GTPase SAR1 family protein
LTVYVAGQERYRALTRQYYKGSQGVVVMYVKGRRRERAEGKAGEGEEKEHGEEGTSRLGN